MAPGNLGSEAVLDPPNDIFSTDEFPNELCVVSGARLRYEPRYDGRFAMYELALYTPDVFTDAAITYNPTYDQYMGVLWR